VNSTTSVPPRSRAPRNRPRSTLVMGAVLVLGALAIVTATAPSRIAGPDRAVVPGSEPVIAIGSVTGPAAPDHAVSLRLLLPWDPGTTQSSAPAELTAWLGAVGLTVPDDRAQLGTLEVHGTAAAFERAFGTSLVTAEGAGETLTRPAGPLTVPAALSGVVLGVAGTVQADQYQPTSTSTVTDPVPAPLPRARASSRTLSPTTVTTSDECAAYWGEKLSSQWPTRLTFAKRSNRLCGYTPDDLRAIHSVPASQTGKGSRIGIIAAYDDPAVESHTNTYFTQVGAQPLRAGQYVHHAPDEPDEGVCGGPAHWTDEQHLDVQAVHAMAPDADIVYWGANSCRTVDLFQAIYDAGTSGTVDVLSLSFGSREELDTQADRELLNRGLVQAAVNHVSVFASSGNDGDYSAAGDHPEQDVSSPASSPYVTAVGGLSVGLRRDGTLAVVTGWENKPYFARNGGVIPPGFTSGSGGGTSAVYAQPTWQSSITGLPTGGARHVPDVSSLGDPSTGFTIYSTTADGPAYLSVGGTSLASPLVASLVSMAKTSKHLEIGLATPWLYALQGTTAIRDITPQSAAVWSATPVDPGQTWPETIYGWDQRPQSLQTAAGWDPVSGIGMPTGADFFTMFGTRKQDNA